MSPDMLKTYSRDAHSSVTPAQDCSENDAYRHMQRSGVSRLKLLGRHCSKAETAAQGRSQRRGQRRRARLCANTAIASPKARGRPASRRTSPTVDVLALRHPLQWDGGDGGTMAKPRPTIPITHADVVPTFEFTDERWQAIENEARR